MRSLGVGEDSRTNRPGAARNRGRVIRWRSTSEAQYRVAQRVSLFFKLRYGPVGKARRQQGRDAGRWFMGATALAAMTLTTRTSAVPPFFFSFERLTT